MLNKSDFAPKLLPAFSRWQEQPSAASILNRQSGHHEAESSTGNHVTATSASDVVNLFLLSAIGAVRRVAVVCLLLATAAFAGSVSLERDIEYGRAGSERLLLDASVPDGAGLFPVAILVHGGGWKRGDKSGSDKPGDGADISPWFEPLRQAKFTWFSINYRLMPTHPWPAPFEDVQTAIRWVRANGKRFKGDPDRIALFGHSAGGHLVMLAATQMDADTRVQAAVGFAPVIYFDPAIPRRDGLNPTAEDLRSIPGDLPANLLPIVRRPAPIEHVHARMPPILIVHGDADRTVPLPRTISFQQKVRAAGVRCDVIVIKGGPHSLIEGQKIEPSYKPAMIGWLREVLEPRTNRVRR